jgi:membrane glycosyltransferase
MISRAEAKELARRECERQGLPFVEPVSVSAGPRYFRVRTQVDRRGGNVSVFVQRWTGSVELRGVAPR